MIQDEKCHLSLIKRKSNMTNMKEKPIFIILSRIN